jgi:SAM-dependent MidA family methyltransferase
VKDFKEIANNVGKIDLTSYVNFSQLKGVAKANKNSNLNK